MEAGVMEMVSNPEAETPHPAMSGVVDSILETIGNTPIVRLGRLGAGLAPQLLAKVEYFNPGGSVKDRIGVNIVDAAEREGRLQPGGTIVEPTSGNTGVGLAMVAALRGYKTIFVMPDKMSEEKIRALRAYGSRVVIAPTAVEPDDPRSYYSVANRLVAETPGAILGNQYHNPANPESHFKSTGPEIWQQTEGRVTHFICSLGTGGTISGVGRYLKSQNPEIQIVGVDPEGSILRELFYTGTSGPARGYLVEGIGEDFLPGTTDFGQVDDVVQVNDAECFAMTRRLVREEGMFVGGSCGAAVAGALKYIRDFELGPEAVVVVLLPDSGSRYLTKVFNDDWMREHGFEVEEAAGDQVADLLKALGPRKLITVGPKARLREVVALMKSNDISQVPVVDESGALLGSVGERDVLDWMLEPSHRHASEETVAALMGDRIAEVSPSLPLVELGEIFAARGIVAVRDQGAISAVFTKIDLIDYLTQRAEA
jgi:cystathionine beta-synthase